MTRSKKVFISIFLGFTVVLLILPFLVATNEFLTKVIEKNHLYGFIQAKIVPLEAKMMGAMLIPFGYDFIFSSSNNLLSVNGVVMEITWNCLGWQSFLLLFLSFIVGFKGSYSAFSKTEVFLIGILGTFWLNILRMLFTVLLAVHAPPFFRIVFHDYLAAGTTVVWLFFFWHFAYSYVLRPVGSKEGIL